MNETARILQSLVVSAHRLTRVAAQSSGDRTSPAIWRTLSILESDGPMRLGELASQSRVSQPTMSKIVAGLASDDLIRRIADTDDARSWLIATTPKGQKLLADWLTRVADEASSMFDGLSDEEWSTLAAAAVLLERGFDSKQVAA